MSKHYFSGDQCIKEAFNPESNSLDVNIKDLTIGFSLNHRQDSVKIVPETMAETLNPDTPVTISGLKQMTIYAPLGTLVKVSPVRDGDIWYTVGTIPESSCLTLNMCATRLIINNSGYIGGV